MSSSAAPLRQLIAETATHLGPDAPTLCDPWDVRALLAHLVVRESRPDALPGIGLPVAALQRHTASVQGSVAATEFSALVGKVRSGPAPWWPTRLPVLDGLVNTAELAVHLEDMVRAQPDWEPSVLPREVQAALWRTLRGAGRMLYGSAPTGVVAIAEGHGRVALRRPPGGAGTVVLRGTPLELVLHAFGRDRVARVAVEGEEADVAALAAHRRGA
jgi:uncharacterized protein (TIGR03085 family)